MKAAILTLGCKVNRYESNDIACKLTEYGWQVADNLSYADIYIINTCAVTAEAHSKSRQMIARALRHNPDAFVYVIGCGSEFAPESFCRDRVAYILGADGKERLVDIIKQDYPIYFAKDKDIVPISGVLESRTRAYVKIQDGCNNACSYCIIPHLRGKSISRPIEQIVQEATALAEHYQEIVLVGINISLYGIDIGTSLPNLITALSHISSRVRLSSFYVEAITSELLDALSKMQAFCDHFHISAQSGDDKILKDMNRRYTAKECLERIQLIRQCFPNAGITADIISGFPTEDEQNFNNTLEFVRKTAFSDIHCFLYSPRKGTRAALLPPLAKDIAKARQEKLLAEAIRLKTNFLNANLDKELEVLFEERKGAMYCGYSGNYIRIYSSSPLEGRHKIKATKLFKDGLLIKGGE